MPDAWKAESPPLTVSIAASRVAGKGILSSDVLLTSRSQGNMHDYVFFPFHSSSSSSSDSKLADPQRKEVLI